MWAYVSNFMLFPNFYKKMINLILWFSGACVWNAPEKQWIWMGSVRYAGKLLWMWLKFTTLKIVILIIWSFLNPRAISRFMPVNVRNYCRLLRIIIVNILFWNKSFNFTTQIFGVGRRAKRLKLLRMAILCVSSACMSIVGSAGDFYADHLMCNEKAKRQTAKTALRAVVDIRVCRVVVSAIALTPRGTKCHYEHELKCSQTSSAPSLLSSAKFEVSWFLLNLLKRIQFFDFANIYSRKTLVFTNFLFFDGRGTVVEESGGRVSVSKC